MKHSITKHIYSILFLCQPIPVGKQYSGPADRPYAFIFYTPTTGIWQSVWLEPVPDDHITSLVLTPDLDAKSLMIKINTDNTMIKTPATVTVYDGDNVIVHQEAAANEQLDIKLGDSIKTWSPENPFLYDLKIMLETGDAVTSYFGMRKIEIRKVDKFQRIFLNNQLLPFQAGPLDQGYWPDGIYTPPTEEAMIWDLKQTKEMGFNFIRKHIKLGTEMQAY